MKTTPQTLPYGHPSTLRDAPGGHECKGNYRLSGFNTDMEYHPRQEAWMQENKPLYYTGDLHNDISHLPLELRSL